MIKTCNISRSVCLFKCIEIRISNILPEKLSWYKMHAFFHVPNPFIAGKWHEWPSTGLSLGDWGSVHDSLVPLWCLAYHFVPLWSASLIFKMWLGKPPLESSFQLQMKTVIHKNQVIINYCVINVTAQLYLTIVLWRLSGGCCRHLATSVSFFLG